MSAAREVGDCPRFDRWLTAYVDDELDAVHALEVEDHLASCEDCAEMVANIEATRLSLQRVCRMRAPCALRERIMGSLDRQGLVDDDCERSSASPDAPAGASVDGEPAGAQHRKPLRYLVPLAAAATFALVLGAALTEMGLTEMGLTEMGIQNPGGSELARAPGQESPKLVSDEAAVAQISPLDNLIEDLVVQHAAPPPMETTDPDGLRRFDPFIGVHIRQPSFDPAEARYVGARMANRQAAMLQYVLRDRHRVSIYVFDPKKVTLRETDRLHPRQVHAHQVYVGMVRGYSVAASERNGIGYALASDLNDQESAELLAMAAR